MTIEEAYLKFIQKVNKNYTNDNISVDRGRFIQIFNESQNKFVEWVIEKRNSDDIRDIQQLAMLDVKLKKKGDFVEHQSFVLPSDLFEFLNVKAFASTKTCQGGRMYLYEIKHEDLEEVLQDKNSKPSFFYREAPYTIGGGNINIYIDNFSLDKVFLNYYRYPVQVDIEGYIKIDNTPSKSINPEFDDAVTDRILSIAAKEFDFNSENYSKTQLSVNRIASEY